MKRTWIASLIAALLLTSIVFAQAKDPSFTEKDKQAIQTYYSRLSGTLAPGSLDRSTFAPNVEQALVKGAHVMQFEKDLQPLPSKLEAQLSPVTGDFGHYTLGRHVVLVKKSGLEVVDILRNVAVATK